jgi:hypothetical protein
MMCKEHDGTVGK